MNTEQAKEILLLFHPAVVDRDLPELSTALDLIKREPALRDWFARHCATQNKIRAAFQAVAVPEGLREQIISERPWHSRQVTLKQMLAGLVAIALVLGAVTATAKWLRYRDASSFPAFRQQMLTTALYGYDMELETNSFELIRGYLASHRAPADYKLPDGLAKFTARGCVATAWRGHRVAMICLRTAARPPAKRGEDVWLFVTDPDVARDAPTSARPKCEEASGLTTASWAAEGRTYLLAARGNRAMVKELLGVECD